MNVVRVQERLGEKMEKVVVVTENAPEAIGPYSQAIVANGFAFVSGQIPIDPSTGEIEPGGIRQQAERALENLKAIMEAAGSSMESVVKTTIYLANMDDFGAVNEVYKGYFPKDQPARATVEVSRLPRGVMVEIDAVALKA